VTSRTEKNNLSKSNLDDRPERGFPVFQTINLNEMRNRTKERKEKIHKRRIIKFRTLIKSEFSIKIWGSTVQILN
jgi:hypothetical protein